MENITVDQLKSQLTEDPSIPLIDIREPMEHAMGLVPGAKPLPMSQLMARIGELNDHKEGVYIVCQTGSRSQSVCGFLENQGFRAINVAGGTSAWVRAGYELARA